MQIIAFAFLAAANPASTSTLQVELHGVRNSRGVIHAYDSRNGTELWSHNDGIGHNGGIISYSAKGKQYVTVAVGWGSLVGDNFPKMFGGAYTSMPTDQGYLVTYTLP